MIKEKSELIRVLNEERNLYISKSDNLELHVTSDNKIKIFKLVSCVRHLEYHHNNKGLYHRLMRLWYWRRKNLLGRRLGIEIWDNSFDSGLLIYHAGNIVVNGNAKIGKNCRLHGSNCIGNKGPDSLGCPTIGDNVRIGVGAKIIGEIKIADNITVAAGAVVVDSFEEEGITIGGVPARKIR